MTNPPIYPITSRKKRTRTQLAFANAANFIPEKRKRYDPEITVERFEAAIRKAKKKKTRRLKNPGVDLLLRSLFFDGIAKVSAPEEPQAPQLSNEELAEMTLRVTKEVEELQKSNEALSEQNDGHWQKYISRLKNISG